MNNNNFHTEISLRQIFLTILSFFIGMIVLFLLIIPITEFIVPNDEVFSKKHLSIFLAILWQISVLCFFIYYSKKNKLIKNFFGFAIPKSWKYFLFAWLGAHCIFIIYRLLILLLESFGLEISTLAEQQVLPLNNEDNIYFLIMMIISITILAPISEEILFRGYMLQSLLTHFSVRTSSIISAIFFSMFHLQLSVLIPFMLVGWLFSITRIKSGSIWPSIFAHVSVNTISIFFVLMM